MKRLIPKTLIFALMLAVVFTMMPNTMQNVYADSAEPAIVMGTSVLAKNVNEDGLQRVWFGRYLDPPTKKRMWYVIGYDGEGSNPASRKGIITILHKYISSFSGGERFSGNSNVSYANQYSVANIRWIVNSYYNGNGDWKWNNWKEKDIIVKRVLEGGGSNYGEKGYDENKIKGNSVEDAGFWLLSCGEAEALPGGIRHLYNDNTWWLRSPGQYDGKAAYCWTDYNYKYTVVIKDGVSTDTYHGVRPACDLDMNAILFTSAAERGKVSGSGADALTEVAGNGNNEWKLTIKDASRDAFDITTCEGSYDSESGAVTFRYSGAKVESNSFISAIILGSDDSIRYYGRIAEVSEESEGSGQITVNTSGKMESGDKLYVFNEQYNGDKTTDYASDLIEVSLPTTGEHEWTEATCVDPQKCTICGKTASPELGHDYQEVDGTAEAATCSKEGKEPDQECTRCGDLIEGETIPALGPASGHEWIVDESTDEDGWRASTTGGSIHEERTCSICGLVEKRDTASTHDHRSVPMSFCEERPATCATNGVRKHYECNCGNWFEADSDENPVYDDPKTPDDFILPALRHEREFTGWTWVGDEEKGYSEAAASYVCKREGCGDIRKMRITPTTRVIQPTCTNGGRTVYRVQISSIDAFDSTIRSDEREAKFTEALGHNYQEVENTANAPTCTTPGNEAYLECSHCHDVIDGETIPALGHDWGDWKVTTLATETGEGLKERTCSRCGEQETQTIPKIGPGQVSIRNAEVILSASAYTYNGKVRKPSIKTIGSKTLKAGTDYTVKWSNASPKNVGSYTITITGKGNYTGTTQATFKINPKGTSIVRLKKAKGQKNAVTVKWKKQSAKMSKSRVNGYQIQLATNKKFTKNRKLVTVKKYKKVSKKVTKLKGRKKYYVRVRTYKKVGGVRYYSPWSKIKTVRTR